MYGATFCPEIFRHLSDGYVYYEPRVIRKNLVTSPMDTKCINEYRLTEEGKTTTTGSSSNFRHRERWGQNTISTQSGQIDRSSVWSRHWIRGLLYVFASMWKYFILVTRRITRTIIWTCYNFSVNVNRTCSNVRMNCIRSTVCRPPAPGRQIKIVRISSNVDDA